MKESYQTLFADFNGNKSEIIPLLQKVQDEHGFLPMEGIEAIADFTGIPACRVYSVATFYAQFRFSPVGRNHIMVCRGTACHIKGAPLLLEALEKKLGISEGETTEDMEFSLETVACIGACGLAPAMVVNHNTFGRLTPKKAAAVLDGLMGGDND